MGSLVSPNDLKDYKIINKNICYLENISVSEDFNEKNSRQGFETSFSHFVVPYHPHNPLRFYSSHAQVNKILLFSLVEGSNH